MKLVVEIELSHDVTRSFSNPVKTYTDLGKLLEQLGSDFKNNFGPTIPKDNHRGKFFDKKGNWVGGWWIR